MLFFFNDTATTEIYTLSLHDALPISPSVPTAPCAAWHSSAADTAGPSLAPCWSATRRSEEHTSELQSQSNLVCRLLLEKKKPAQSRPAPDHALSAPLDSVHSDY